MSDKVENLDGLDAVDLFDKRSLASIAISLKRIADHPASVDTHAQRGDSTQIEAPSPMGSAVGEAETPTRSRQSNKPGREM